MASTSARTRTTITTRFDSPVPKKRSKKRKQSSAAVAILIVILAIIAWRLSTQQQRPTLRRPAAAQLHR